MPLLAFNPSLPPNLAAHGIMAVLIGAQLSPVAAERLLLVLYAVLLPASLKYAMRGASERTGGLEYLALPVVFNSHLHWGFLNFLLGLVGFLCAFGLWLRLRGRVADVASAAAMTGVLTAVYFCHPVPLIEFWIASAVLLAFDRARGRDSAAADARLLLLVSAVPAALLLHSVLARPPALVVEPQLAWPTIRYAGMSLVTLAPLASYTTVERIVAGCVALFAAVGAVMVWTNARGTEARALLGAATVAALIVFAAPSQAAGATLVTARLVYFPLFLVLVAMTTVAWPASWTTGFIVLALSLSCISTVSRWPIYERYDARMREFLRLAETLPLPDRLYFAVTGEPTTMTLDDRGTPNLPASAWGYVAARRSQWLASDYEPLLTYFPFVYRTAPQHHASVPPSCGQLSLPALQSSAAGIDPAPIVIWMRLDRPELRACSHSAPGVWKEARGEDGALVAWWPASTAGPASVTP